MQKMPYDKYLGSKHWKKKRKKCYFHYNGKCTICGFNGKPSQMNVHHLNYSNLWNERIGKDIVLLCSSCHRKLHDKKFDTPAWKLNIIDNFIPNNAFDDTKQIKKEKSKVPTKTKTHRKIDLDINRDKFEKVIKTF